jgi:hypothetical protein
MGRHARRNDNTKADNNYADGVEQFRYLGKALTNQNSILEEIKSSVKEVRAPSVFVAHVFACIITCRLHKLTLPDQAQITLQLTVFPI